MCGLLHPRVICRKPSLSAVCSLAWFLTAPAQAGLLQRGSDAGSLGHLGNFLDNFFGFNSEKETVKNFIKPPL